MDALPIFVRTSSAAIRSATSRCVTNNGLAILPTYGVHSMASLWQIVCRSFCCVLMLWLTACAQTAVATPTPVNVTIAGATAMQPVLYDLTTAYSRRHPNVRFDLRGGGSTVGEERVRSGQVDLGASTLTAG